MLDLLLEPAAEQIDIDKAALIKQAKEIKAACIKKSFAYSGPLPSNSLGGASGLGAQLRQI